jgi:hypothetical protein
MERNDNSLHVLLLCSEIFQGNKVPVTEKNEDALLASSCKKLAQRGCYVIRSIFTDERAQRLDQRL